jgi:hypothetical protein
MELIHPRSSRVRWTIVLRAYLDASGKLPKDDVISVAGFVSGETAWTAFEALWRPMLNEHGLDRFHATEYFLRRRAPYNSEASRLRMKRQIKDAFADVRPFGIGTAVSVAAFDEWRMSAPYYVQPDPYYFCIDQCLHLLIRGISTPVDEGIAIYCDQELEHHKIGLDIAEWHENHLRKLRVRLPGSPDPQRLVSTHYVSSTDFVPVQAADIAANGAFNQLKRFLETKQAYPKMEFLEVLDEAKCPFGVTYFDDPKMFEILVGARLRADRERLERYGGAPSDEAE